MTMKRSRENAEIETIDMARCLMLLSHSIQAQPIKKHVKTEIFECKTCNRTFPSFQALGGHRASHKRPRLMGEQKLNDEDTAAPKALSLPTKPKMHECSICGQEFSLGQALGGHMRRHRAAMMDGGFAAAALPRPAVMSKLPVLRRSKSSKRVFGLDLNLTPLENDLEYLFGKMAPKVVGFL